MVDYWLRLWNFNPQTTKTNLMSLRMTWPKLQIQPDCNCRRFTAQKIASFMQITMQLFNTDFELLCSLEPEAKYSFWADSQMNHDGSRCVYIHD